MEAHLSALKPLDLRAAALKPLDTNHAAPPSPPNNDDERPPEQLHLALGNMNRFIDDNRTLVVTRVGPPQPQYTVSTHITVVRQSDQQNCTEDCMRRVPWRSRWTEACICAAGCMCSRITRRAHTSDLIKSS